jgi:septal ring factor EnvC (AmiA/AmiB activator)
MGRWVIVATCGLVMCVAGSSGVSILARVDTTLDHLGIANNQLMTANTQLGRANQQLAEMKSRLTEVNQQLLATNHRLHATQAQVGIANAKIDKTNAGLAQTIAQLAETKDALAKTNGNLDVIEQAIQKIPLLRSSGLKPSTGTNDTERMPLACPVNIPLPSASGRTKGTGGAGR